MSFDARMSKMTMRERRKREKNLHSVSNTLLQRQQRHAIKVNHHITFLPQSISQSVSQSVHKPTIHNKKNCSDGLEYIRALADGFLLSK